MNAPATIAASFTGFGPAVTDWFVALANDNSRAYWAATKDVWQRDVRAPLEDLLEEVAAEGGERPKLFRPHRDLRFARDAGPLKSATGGYVPNADRSPAVRYVELSARGLMAATGYHQLAADQLERYRAAAAGPAAPALARALEAVRAAGLEVGGNRLKTTPRGVPRDHPHAALLRHKSLTVAAWMPPGDALETREPLEFAVGTWAAAEPVVAWLDRNVGVSRLDPDEVRGRGRRR
ncbi:MAG: DUF2461 family protein [Trueperaceae bacterium]